MSLTTERLAGIEEQLNESSDSLYDTYDFSVALRETKDIALELREEVRRLQPEDVLRSVLENLVTMKGQVIGTLEADLQDAVENDRRMQESVIREKLEQLRMQKRALEEMLASKGDR
jgi:hypothetical protein